MVRRQIKYAIAGYVCPRGIQRAMDSNENGVGKTGEKIADFRPIDRFILEAQAYRYNKN